MGAAASSGDDQDDLCDILVEGGYMRTPMAEKVMRAVDRAHYITSTGLEPPNKIAYRDLAWKSGNLHISSPCIYAEVLEQLELKEGLSFLNIGSGTGYLSTVVGLMLGPYGVNHGIELYQDVIEYANERLAHFRANSPAIDAFHFCQPTFVRGCGLQLQGGERLYDRVYCGAAVPHLHKQHMMELIKVGGILVMPYNDSLVQVVRASETRWQWTNVLPVSFSSLQPTQAPAPVLPELIPTRLDEACRAVIRITVRRVAEMCHPNMVLLHRQPRPPRNKEIMNCISDSSEDECLTNLSYLPNVISRLVEGNQRLRVFRHRRNTFSEEENYASDEDNDGNGGDGGEGNGDENVGDDEVNQPSSPERLSIPVSIPRRRRGGNRAKREKFDVGVLGDSNDEGNDSWETSDDEEMTDRKKAVESSDNGATHSTAARKESPIPVEEPMVLADDESAINETPAPTSSASDNTEPKEMEETELPPLYSTVMRDMLSQLPLPPALIAYLNFYRN